MEWRTIESAPKDKRILLNFGPKVSAGKWDDQYYHSKPRPFWRSDSIMPASWDRENQPTHWMPLPEPPVATAEKEQAEGGGK